MRLARPRPRRLSTWIAPRIHDREGLGFGSKRPSVQARRALPLRLRAWVLLDHLQSRRDVELRSRQRKAYGALRRNVELRNFDARSAVQRGRHAGDPGGQAALCVGGDLRLRREPAGHPRLSLPDCLPRTRDLPDPDAGAARGECDDHDAACGLLARPNVLEADARRLLRELCGGGYYGGLHVG